MRLSMTWKRWQICSRLCIPSDMRRRNDTCHLLANFSARLVKDRRRTKGRTEPTVICIEIKARHTCTLTSTNNQENQQTEKPSGAASGNREGITQPKNIPSAFQRICLHWGNGDKVGLAVSLSREQMAVLYKLVVVNSFFFFEIIFMETIMSFPVSRRLHNQCRTIERLSLTQTGDGSSF